MARNLLWFLLGGVTAVVFMLRYVGEDSPASASIDERISSSSEVFVSEEVEPRSPAESSVDNESIQVAPIGSEDLAEPANQPSDSSFQALAASLQSTPEEVERLTERSFETLSGSPDRLRRFNDESQRQEVRLLQLENVVVNELWRNVDSNPPVAVESECRASGCRVRLFFGTMDGLRAAAQSPLDLRVLFTLQRHGFEATESLLEFESADPDAPARALDIYFWPKQQGVLQSVVSQPG